MSHYHADNAEYMADEYDMEDIDDDMDEEFRGRDMGGSDSDVDEYDYSVCDIFHSAYVENFKHYLALSFELIWMLLLHVWSFFSFCLSIVVYKRFDVTGAE